ncbi:MAG: FAD-dependent oxidoreductase [Candidatus Thermoplasmatota archaeon]|nr:FAD-dependent oxidoreductase [Candidatus Thermoplasmatota archaeon]MCL5785236.1 FAD-dependent oxidoreductase [Candidatus Thermoplasmatota archaeon]
MSEFDAIIVGAGPAGSSAAIKLASSGLTTLLVEKADPPGSKNVSGGIMWGNELGGVLPDWEKDAPLERYVISKGTGLLTSDSLISVDFRSRKFESRKTGYSVLRAKFDQYLANKAKSKGATLVTGVTVDGLALKDGKVAGVIQEGDEITADTVILAEGVNPRVAISSGLRPEIGDKDVAIGVKQVVKLSEATINERFNIRGNSGFAGEYVLGFLKNGVKAGGFLYTNKETISVGAVINVGTLRADNETHSFEIMDQFVNHPFISPYLEGGKMEEYSAHLVCEGGIGSVPKIYGDGYLIAGDAAGFSYSNGLIIQGINYAITSGIAAADTVIEAKSKSNFSSGMLRGYEDRLQGKYVLKDLKKFRGIEEVTWSNLAHKALPDIAEETLFNLFYEEGIPKRHLMEIVLSATKKSGVKKTDMILEAYRTMRRM